MELPNDPENPILDTNQKKTKTLTQKDIGTPLFIAALFGLPW